MAAKWWACWAFWRLKVYTIFSIGTLSSRSLQLLGAHQQWAQVQTNTAWFAIRSTYKSRTGLALVYTEKSSNNKTISLSSVCSTSASERFSWAIQQASHVESCTGSLCAGLCGHSTELLPLLDGYIKGTIVRTIFRCARALPVHIRPKEHALCDRESLNLRSQFGGLSLFFDHNEI